MAPPTAAPPGPAAPALLRAIGRWDLTAAVVNAVIGSAIFSMPARQAELTGAWSPLAYLAAGVGILAIVLSFAEVASRFQTAGGPYLYAREAFGPWVGFQAGWLTFWIRVTALAANLNVFADSLAQLLPLAARPGARAAVMLGLVALVTLANLAGVRQATWTVNAFTVAKLLPLFLLIALGLGHMRSEVVATQQVAHAQWERAILLLVFAYGGFEAPLIPAGEALRPQRDSSFALLAALSLIAGVYMLVQLVVVGVVPHAAGTRTPVVAALAILMGPVGAVLAALAAMISIVGYAAGTVLQSPRVLYSMAQARELPAVLARVDPHTRTPFLAILTFSVLATILAVFGSFEWNASLSAVVRLLTYGLTCVSVLVFRTRREPAPFRMPAGRLVAPLGALFCLRLLFAQTFAQAWILAGLIALGALVWASGRARRGALALTAEGGPGGQ